MTRRGTRSRAGANNFKKKVRSAPTVKFTSKPIKRSLQGPANIGKFPQLYHSPSKLSGFEKKMREVHRKFGINAKYGSR